VDATDEQLMTYTVKFKSRRWHVIVFCDLLDLSAFNAFVVHTLFDPQWNNRKLHRRRLYLLELGNALISQHIQRRQTLMQLPNANPTSAQAQKRGLCVRCSSDRKKCSARCAGCNGFLCKEHSQVLCLVCASR